MATESEVQRIWAMCVKTYPAFGQNVPAEDMAMTIQIYERLLADIPADVLERACVAHMARSRFFPTIAELRELAVASSTPAIPSALEAWGDVLAAMLTVDTYFRPPAFANQITQRVVNAIGWNSLCRSDNEVADRAHFVAAYNELARRQQEAARTPAGLLHQGKPPSGFTISSGQEPARALPKPAVATAGDVTGLVAANTNHHTNGKGCK